MKWPVGLGGKKKEGGKGSEGVAGLVKQNPGAVGYGELAYADQNKIPYANMKIRPATSFRRSRIRQRRAGHGKNPG